MDPENWGFILIVVHFASMGRSEVTCHKACREHSWMLVSEAKVRTYQKQPLLPCRECGLSSCGTCVLRAHLNACSRRNPSLPVWKWTSGWVRGGLWVVRQVVRTLPISKQIIWVVRLVVRTLAISKQKYLSSPAGRARTPNLKHNYLSSPAGRAHTPTWIRFFDRWIHTRIPNWNYKTTTRQLQIKWKLFMFS